MFRCRGGKQLWLLVSLVFFVVPLLASCNSDKSVTVVLSGKATFPSEVSGPLGAVPVSNASFSVLNLDGGTPNPVAFGATDSGGNFAATVSAANVVAIVIQSPPPGGALGSVRVSGLIDSRNGSVAKNFDGVTDIACEAGVTSIVDGSVAAFRMDESRIAILEAAATQVIAELGVDYTDKESVSAAARRLREITNNGETLP